MADRPPTPPRKVQAPKVRQHERRPAEVADRKKRALLYAVSSAGLGALVVVVFVLARGGGGAGDESAVAAAMRKAGCTLKSVPAQKGEHLDSLEAKPKHNSTPPSSGPHYFETAPWGTYDDPVSALRLVHNLEHGGVVIQYGPKAPDGAADALVSFWRDDPNGMTVSPLPSLGDKIALAAWTVEDGRAREKDYHGEGRVATCPRFDQKAFETFREEFRFKGPERFPEDALEPGE